MYSWFDAQLDQKILHTVPSSVMEVNRISKQTLGSYRFACLFPLLACPMLTMILHIFTLSDKTEFVFVKDLFEPFTLFLCLQRKIQGLKFSMYVHMKKKICDSK